MKIFTMTSSQCRLAVPAFAVSAWNGARVRGFAAVTKAAPAAVRVHAVTTGDVVADAMTDVPVHKRTAPVLIFDSSPPV